MLYVSTRNKLDSFTAHRALHEERAPDNGMFVPFHLTAFSQDDLEKLKEHTFSETVARILNLFFSKQLSGWDIEFSIGRYPLRIEYLNQRIVVAELWHNTKHDYAHLVESIYQRLIAEENQTPNPPQWVKIAVEVAILFGLYGELQKKGIDSCDIAVSSENFLYPVSAWYARKMGLPIQCIICSCNESGVVWDFLQRGELTSDSAHVGCLEHLIYGTLGLNCVQTCLKADESEVSVQLTEEELQLLNEGFFAAVVGKNRTDAVMNSLYRTNAYIADPVTAVSYGALQDFRARTGENRVTLLLSRHSPALHAAQIACAIGCPQEKLKAMIHLSRE